MSEENTEENTEEKPEETSEDEKKEESTSEETKEESKPEEKKEEETSDEGEKKEEEEAEEGSEEKKEKKEEDKDEDEGEEPSSSETVNFKGMTVVSKVPGLPNGEWLTVAVLCPEKEINDTIIGNFLDTFDVQRKHRRDTQEKIVEKLTEMIDKYTAKNKGVYVILKTRKKISALVTGEFISDPDVKMEALELCKL